MIEFAQENMLAIGQISISIVTALIAYFVYKSTKTIGKLAQTRFITEQIQNINMLLLNDKELAEAISTSKSRGDYSVKDISEYKKRRMIIMQLQIGNAAYTGNKNGYLDDDIFDDYMDALINRWIVDHKEYTLSILENSFSDYGQYLANKIRESMSDG